MMRIEFPTPPAPPPPPPSIGGADRAPSTTTTVGKQLLQPIITQCVNATDGIATVVVVAIIHQIIWRISPSNDGAGAPRNCNPGSTNQSCTKHSSDDPEIDWVD